MKLLSNLVKIESISGTETKLANFLFSYLKSLGLNPFFQEENVIVQIKGKNPNKAIIFNAHMDTVPSGDISFWKYPPVGKKAGVCVDNKLYGLGASDDKSGIAALLLLAEKLHKNEPKIDTWLTFVIKEEIDGSGTKNFIKWFKDKGLLKKYKDISAVICEPTDLEEIKIGHRGNIFIQITVDGDGGHGSKPQMVKLNAINEAYEIIKLLQKQGKSWEVEYKHAILGKPTLAITSLTCGNKLSPNKFPDSCILTLDIRTTPLLHKNALLLIKQSLKQFKATVAYLYEPTPFGMTNPKEKIVQKMLQLTKAKVTINVGSNDLCFFTQAKIPGVIFGPGKHEGIHKANEFCEVSKIDEAVEIYSQLV